jgi:hypothetical protein
MIAMMYFPRNGDRGGLEDVPHISMIRDNVVSGTMGNRRDSDNYFRFCTSCDWTYLGASQEEKAVNFSMENRVGMADPDQGLTIHSCDGRAPTLNR